LIRQKGGLKFGPAGGGAIDVGNASFIVSDHYLSEAEINSLPNNTLVVVYDPSNFTAKYGTSPYEIAANAGYAGSEKTYNDALSQVGNLGDVLTAILGEG
jgi:hypothetical protein